MREMKRNNKLVKIQYDKMLSFLRMHSKMIILSIALILILGIVIGWAICPNNSPSWTGFGKQKIIDGYKHSKTLWDWLEIALIPVTIAVGSWYFGNIEKKRENQRFQNQIFSNYLELITNLLIEKDFSGSGNEKFRRIARSHTLKVFREVDGYKKGAILQFLYENELIFSSPIINLNGVNISQAELSNICLKDASAKGVHFNHSEITHANLDGADFSGSNFEGSNLSNSTFIGSNLTHASFIKAKLHNCDLTSSNLDGADFNFADINNSKITKKQSKMIVGNSSGFNII